MKAILINFFLLTALLSLVSCGSSKQDVSLKVSAGFAISSAGYTGGLIAYGENGKGDRFSVAANGGQTLNVALENGDWKVYVMGWEEANGLKFRGTKYCGMTSVKLAADTKDINVTINPTNCSSAEFQSDAGVQNLLISSCGAFYKYNSAQNYYQPLTAADADTFCNSLPSGQSATLPYYKLVSTNIVGKDFTPGISSECLPTSPATVVRLAIPTKKYPWSVQMYRSLADCQTANSKFEGYKFPTGIVDGNQPSFDQHFMVTANSDARLFLPSSKTRRGYSPFIHLIPRILCSEDASPTDCFSAPEAASMSSPFSSTEKVNVDVRWESNSKNGNNRLPVLFKGYKAANVEAQCDAATLGQLNFSPYFSLNQCRIERGNLVGDFTRNAFTCRGNADMSGMLDIYEKNGLIYLVNQYYNSGYDYKVLVYSKTGTLFNEIQIPHFPGQTYKSMTVDQNGMVYVLMDTLSTPGKQLHRFIFNGAENQYTAVTPLLDSTAYSILANIEKIESISDDTMVLATSTDIRAVKMSTLSTPSGTWTAIFGASSLQKLQFKDGLLFVLNTDVTPSSRIHTASVNTSTSTIVVGNAGAAAIYPPAVTESFHVATINGSRYIFLNPRSAGNAKVYNLNVDTTLGAMAAQFSTTDNGFASLLTDGYVYTMEGSGPSYASFKTWTFTPGTSVIVSAHAPNLDLCEAQLNGSSLGIAGKLNISARRNSGVKMVFEEALRSFGRRTVASEASTRYFESLQSDDEDDQARSQGTLRRPSEMLGPDGLGGIIGGLYPNTTCQQLKTAAGSTGLTNTFSLTDNFKGESRSYAINITVPTANMPDYICPSGPCSQKFDLALQISAPGKEKMKIQISCADKIGSIESAEIDEEGTDHELTIWNTVASASMRFENYQIEDRIENNENKKRITVAALKKTDLNNAVHRYMEINRTSTHIDGRVSETAVQGTNLMTTSLNTGSLQYSDFTTSNTNTVGGGLQIQIIVGATSLSPSFPYAAACTSTSNIDPLASNNGTCNTATHNMNNLSLNAALLFNLDSLRDYTDGGANAPFYGFFTLQP